MVSSSLAYTLGHMGAGSPAIAAAASQAIVATQQVFLKAILGKTYLNTIKP